MKSFVDVLKQPVAMRISLSNFVLAANIKKMKCDNCFPIFNFVVFYTAFFASASLMMLRMRI